MNDKPSPVLSVVLGIGLAVLLLGVTSAWAEPASSGMRAPLAPASTVPTAISYQGRLLDHNGSPVNGTLAITFRVYTQPSGGSALVTYNTAVPVEQGLFNVQIPVDEGIFDGQALWLGVQVEGDAQEMTPRQPLLPAPYAFSLRPGATISGSLPAGNAGVLHVVNTDGSTSGDYAISALNYSGNTWRPAIYGENRGASAGVYGRADGWNGVVGWNVSAEWAGVYGRNVGTGSGVRGDSSDGSGVVGFSQTGPGGSFNSQEGHALVTNQPSLIQGPNPKQIALLRWYPSIRTSISFTVGTSPSGIAFDGANMWVTNYGDGTVSVLRASDGANVMTPNVGAYPWGIAYDGVNMWVANGGAATVSVLRASDGTPVMTPNVGNGPQNIAFDGTNMWVTNINDDSVSVLRASDGSHVMTVNTGSTPIGIAFDGANMWVTNINDNTVSVLRASDGANVMTVNTGSLPYGIAFDGANMWVVTGGDDTVSVLRASDGANLLTPNVGAHPFAIAFDGANMWVANVNDSTVSVLRASDGQLVTTVDVGISPVAIAFDGANMWVANQGSRTVSKR
ncbi:MAG: YncE family protein [Anaerolineales bacterium]